jgi:hypothetical protein
MTSGSIMNIRYNYDDKNKSLLSVYLQGEELTGLISRHLHFSVQTHNLPFELSSRNIVLNPLIEMICNNIFLTVEQIKLMKKDEDLALSFTNYLFERLADYWSLDLLKNGKDMTGISFWQAILEITKKWENSNINGVKIHKGTPYYFLAENYLLVGNRDLAFVYLFSAINEDRNIGKSVPTLKYPKESPAFLTATMNKSPYQHMRFIIKRTRNLLNDYITSFHINLPSHSSFSLDDFDTKFLENDSLLDIVAFFVSNFMYLYDFNQATKTENWQNDFSRLRSRHVF